MIMSFLLRIVIINPHHNNTKNNINNSHDTKTIYQSNIDNYNDNDSDKKNAIIQKNKLISANTF